MLKVQGVKAIAVFPLSQLGGISVFFHLTSAGRNNGMKKMWN